MNDEDRQKGLTIKVNDKDKQHQITNDTDKR